MKILFVQHAGALGGSTLSLLYTMQELSRQGFKCEVALINNSLEVSDLYQKAGFSVHFTSGISIFSHTTGGWACWRQPRSLLRFVTELLRWKKSGKATLCAIRRIKPDIVHLNSVVLSPSASALSKAKIPFVWHIRECPPYQGLRTHFLRKLILRMPYVIFICENDKEQWVKSRHGVVIPNFVDWKTIENALSREQSRQKLGIDKGAKVIVYVGGLSRIKGFRVLLEAIPLIYGKEKKLKVFMLFSRPVLATRGLKKAVQTILPIFGLGTPGQMLVKWIHRQGLDNVIDLLPFAPNVFDYFACCDVVVFPSVEPHFARPVIEAAAMSRPVVASDIGGVRELVENGKTGLLVPPNKKVLLASAIISILDNPKVANQFGLFGKERAVELYSATKNVKMIARMYTDIKDR